MRTHALLFAAVLAAVAIVEAQTTDATGRVAALAAASHPTASSGSTNMPQPARPAVATPDTPMTSGDRFDGWTISNPDGSEATVFRTAHAQFLRREAFYEELDVSELRKMADAGDQEAALWLGRAFWRGRQVPTNRVEAVRWYERAAEHGLPEAQCELGFAYRFGHGVGTSAVTAVRWYLSAAEQGLVEAQVALGQVFYDGSSLLWGCEGVTENKTEAFKWYSHAAQQGDRGAQFYVGLALRYGAGVRENDAEAATWYRRAAEQGQATAQWSLGDMYAEGEGVPKDGAEAAKWYRKAAEQGNVDSQRTLGGMYAKGEGVPEDGAEAAKWYRKAAEQGDAIAQYQLGQCYKTGAGVARNETEASKWFGMAAEQPEVLARFGITLSERSVSTSLGMLALFDALSGNLSTNLDDDDSGVLSETNRERELLAEVARSSVDERANLAVLFAKMTFNTDKITEGTLYWATNLLNLASDLGHQCAWRELGGKIGAIYYVGNGVPEDKHAAAEWFHKAAEQGDVGSQRTLGWMYAKGEGVTEDKAEAVEWFRKAAEQGDAIAQWSLGDMYVEGEGVPKDGAEAAKWYRKAAEQGNATAQYQLGWLYSRGEGVLQDDIEAAKWALLAIANGAGNAEGLQQLREGMSPADYAEARRRAKEWHAKHESEDGAVAGSTSEDVAPGEAPTVTGTAFCISGNGYFLTCAHVVEGATTIRLATGGREYPATVVKRDRGNDIAVLKVDGSGFATIPLATAEPTLGDKVFTVGYPNPGLQGQAPKYTDGAISALSGIQDDPRTYQITVPVQTGNSGGPLVDEAGNCVGLVVSKLNAVAMLEYTGDIPQNVNFAVKAAYAWPLVKSIPELRGRLPAPRSGTASTVAEVEKSVGLVMVVGNQRAGY